MIQPINDISTTPERRDMTAQFKKKLIEVSLPLEAINSETKRESTIRQAKPASIHHWWSRKPHVNARAAIFAQLVDDPSSHPEEFPTPELQAIERKRLHDLLEKVSKWENSGDQKLMDAAAAEIRRSNNGELPPVLDPFCGGGVIPLEAQRLGLEAHASDLNPVAVLVTKGLVDIPARFAGSDPVYPDLAGTQNGWQRSEGFAADVRAYGEWMRDQAQRKIGIHYPAVIADGGTSHTVIAWIWARTVRSPNPANPIEVPLVSSWWLSKKKGKEAWVHAEVLDGQVVYTVRHDANGPRGDEDGTIGRQGGYAIGDRTPITFKYVREEAQAGRMGHHLIAVAGDGRPGRVYASPSEQHRQAALVDRPVDVPDADIPKGGPAARNVPLYGMTRFSDLFTNRQLVALTTFSDLISDARERALTDAISAGLPVGQPLAQDGTGAIAYADAIATYLAFALDKTADLNNSLCRWEPVAQCPRNMFGLQAMAMAWEFAESNPFSTSSGSFQVVLDGMVRAMINPSFSIARPRAGSIEQADAATRNYSGLAVITDPPYYNMIGYSDLSDFFYVWLRRSLSPIHPRLFGTLLTPKAEELVANEHRNGGKVGARDHFISGFNGVFGRIRETANPDIPLLVYYAYKQGEGDSSDGGSNGWHTLLSGLISGGWEVTATWPMRTERAGRLTSLGSNAIASTILLSCRPRDAAAPVTSRRAFTATLKATLPEALRYLMQGSVAPVDLAQAAIGPGISVFSRYSRVRESDGSEMSVADALLIINSTLDEVLGEQESDFDPDTRFAVKWYRQYGWGFESSGIADQLARSSDTSISALERGGIFEAKGGKARLLAPSALEGKWDVASDERVSVWETTIRLAAVMSKHGADDVAAMIPTVQTRVDLDAVKELGFLLFHEAERKNDIRDAVLFNGLVSAWGDLNEQARKIEASAPQHSAQQVFDFDDVED